MELSRTPAGTGIPSPEPEGWRYPGGRCVDVGLFSRHGESGGPNQTLAAMMMYSPINASPST